MITFIIFALIVIAIVYLAFFGIFKLIWILCKSHRNVWPLILAGVGTVLFFLTVAGGIWWSAQKIIAPFQPMVKRTKENPDLLLGPRVYQDERFPFELTVFDGMDFSDWIPLKDTYVKIGFDTNAFKQKEIAGNSPLTLWLLRTPIENKEEPFAQWQKFKNEANSQLYFKILKEEKTTVNGLEAYQVDGIAHSNRGPVDVWMTLLNDEGKNLYYLIMLELGPEDKASQIQTIRNSFKRTEPQMTEPPAQHPLPEPSTEEQPA